MRDHSISNRPRWRRPAAVAVRLAALALVSVGCFGCQPRNSIHHISLNRRELKTSGDLIVEVKPNRCYYWVDGKQLKIAMSDYKDSWVSKYLDQTFELSLVLEGLPAGQARTYHSDRRTLRMRWRRGLSHWRAASLDGLVTVWEFGEGNLKGRFRLSCKEQSFFVLTGWGSNTQILLVGEFEARPNRAAGETILAATEQGGMERAKVAPRPRPVRIQGPNMPSAGGSEKR